MEERQKELKEWCEKIITSAREIQRETGRGRMFVVDYAADKFREYLEYGGHRDDIQAEAIRYIDWALRQHVEGCCTVDETIKLIMGSWNSAAENLMWDADPGLKPVRMEEFFNRFKEHYRTLDRDKLYSVLVEAFRSFRRQHKGFVELLEGLYWDSVDTNRAAAAFMLAVEDTELLNVEQAV